MAALAQPVHRGARRADAGKNSEVGRAHVCRLGDSEPGEREPHAAHVAGAVLADRDVHSTPFVDGSPAPSVRTAARNARPTALNAASATWCASRPDALPWIDRASGLREALQHVHRHPGIELELQTRCAPARRDRPRRGRAHRPSARPRRRSVRSRAGRRVPGRARRQRRVPCPRPYGDRRSRDRRRLRSARSKPAWKASCSRKWS